MFKNLMNMKFDNQLLLIVGIFVILFALFWPRDKPLFGASFAANVGNLGGKVQLEAYDEFEGFEGGEKVFAIFYATWCPHCKKMMPEVEKLEQMNNTDIKIVKIDCEANPDMARKFNVEGYPTIKFLPYGLNNPKDAIDYKGERTGERFLAFISNQ